MLTTYIGYALGGALCAMGAGGLAAVGWQLGMCIPTAWTKVRSYKLQVVRK